MQAIATHNLTKKFNDVVALSDVSISINQGEIYGFIGLNGAGKTTLIRMLLGMIKPSEGSVTLFGETVGKNFDRWNSIGYLVETPYSYPQLTVYENLLVHFELRDLSNRAVIDAVIDTLKLTKYRDKKAGVLSLGNQQRLGIAKALLHSPRLLILDEPINGLDPEGIAEVRDLLKDLANSGVTIFLSSHILGEVSRIADRIGIIHQGRLVKELSKKNLEESLNRKLMINTKDNRNAKKILESEGFAVTWNLSSELELTELNAINNPESVIQTLVKSGIYPNLVLPYVEDLEMFFLRTIKQ